MKVTEHDFLCNDWIQTVHLYILCSLLKVRGWHWSQQNMTVIFQTNRKHCSLFKLLCLFQNISVTHLGQKREEKKGLNGASLLLRHQTQQRLYMLFIESLLSVGIAQASCLNYVAWWILPLLLLEICSIYQVCHEDSEFGCHIKNISTMLNFRVTVAKCENRDDSSSLWDKWCWQRWRWLTPT